MATNNEILGDDQIPKSPSDKSSFFSFYQKNYNTFSFLNLDC